MTVVVVYEVTEVSFCCCCCRCSLSCLVWWSLHATISTFILTTSGLLRYRTVQLSLLPSARWERSRVAYGLQGEGLVWLIGAVVSLYFGSRCLLAQARDGRIMHCG